MQFGDDKQSKFFKDKKKLNKPTGQEHFIHFEKLTNAYYTKLQEKLCYYTCVNNLHEKTLQKSKTEKIWKVCALFVICTCVT